MGCKPVILSILMGFGLLASVCFGKYSGGTGEPNDPYLIETPNDLNSIGLDPCDWDKHFKMTADINMAGFTGTQFNIIGGSLPYFSGAFDGNDHTISNFTYNSTGTDYIGLFGGAWRGAEIKNLGLIAPDVNGGTGNDAGSLAGWLSNGTITNCYAQGGNVSNSHWYLGGLVGKNSKGAISDSYASVGVSGRQAGGLAGYNSGDISNCYSTGDVSGDGDVGGLVGRNYANEYSSSGAVSYGTISNCYATGSISGGLSVGGLVGWNDGTVFNNYATGSVSGDNQVGGLVGLNEGTVFNCYSVGSVSGNISVGGLVGFTFDEDAEVEHSFWDVNTSGQASSAGGTGKTTAEMQDPNTFMDAGWDFVNESDGPSDVWAEPNGGGYPVLWWQLLSLPPLPGFSGGTGTVDDPYLISTVSDLNSIGHNPRLMQAHFKLINDIDLIGIDFFIIGDRGNPYAGIFDGNSKKISNFACNSTGKDCIGLFGVVDGPNAEIKDLCLIDPNVDVGTGNWVGSLVGWLKYGALSDCYAGGGSTSGNERVGGLVGYSYMGSIATSASSGSVSGATGVGGLVGESREGAISNSYSLSSVSGDGRVGGLAGDMQSSVFIFGTISNSYSAGSVSGNSSVGGLVGYIDYAEVEHSFWDIEASDCNVSAGGTGLSTAEMQTMTTFTDAGWDFVNIWDLTCEEMNYPRLIWQITPVDYLCPHGVDFKDYSFFANYWQDTNCGGANDCDGTDLDFSNKVDWADLKILADHWLEGTEL